MPPRACVSSKPLGTMAAAATAACGTTAVIGPKALLRPAPMSALAAAGRLSTARDKAAASKRPEAGEGTDRLYAPQDPEAKRHTNLALETAR